MASIYKSLALSEEGADATKASFDAIVNCKLTTEQATAVHRSLKQKQRYSSPVIIFVTVSLFILILLICVCARKEGSSGSASSPSTETSSCTLFPDYEVTGNAQFIRAGLSGLNIDMSDSGKILAISLGSLVLIDDANKQRFEVTFGSENPLETLALSGDGLTVAAATATQVMVVRAKEGSWQNGYERLVDPHSEQLTDPDSQSVSGYIITDLSLNEDGSTLVTALGSKETTQAIYGLGEDRGSWVWDDYQQAVSVIYELKDNNLWEAVVFPSTFQSDNLGYKIAMDGAGTSVIQSTEHDNNNLYMANLLAKTENDWYGEWDSFDLPDLECKQVSSQVDMASDGNTAVVAVQCLPEQPGPVRYHVMTYNMTSRAFEMDPVVRTGTVDSFGESFSITLSGTALTMILAFEGSIELFERRDSTAWASAHEVSFE
jgi:hypothetical protein